MIIGTQKSIEELIALTQPYPRLLLIGCGTCSTVCHTGGKQEISIVARAIILAHQSSATACEIKEIVIHRQCESELCEDLVSLSGDFDAILSFGCAAGVQTIAEKVRHIPIIPAVNTQCLGRIESEDCWVEQCIGCGDCTLQQSSGICLLTRCPKSQMNEPCGGETQSGNCEVNPQLECVWTTLAHRSSEQKLPGQICECVDPKNWEKSHSGGCRVNEISTEN